MSPKAMDMLLCGCNQLGGSAEKTTKHDVLIMYTGSLIVVSVMVCVFFCFCFLLLQIVYFPLSICSHKFQYKKQFNFVFFLSSGMVDGPRRRGV